MGTTPNPATSAVAAETTPGQAPSPSADNGQLTDEQFLDQYAGTGEEGSSAPEGEAAPQEGEAPVGEGAEAPKPETGKEGEEAQAKEGQEEKPEGPVEETEALKAIFKTPGVGPELRRSYYAEKAYREAFSTVQEAREVKQLFPTLEEAQAARDAREDFARFDQLYYENTPEAHGQFLRSLQEEDPQVFQGFARQLPQALHEMDPGLYRESLAVPIVQSTLSTLRQMAEGQDDENLRNAVEVISMRLFNQGLEAPGRAAHDPRELKLSQRESALADREQKAEEASFNGFFRSANEETVTKLIGDIEGMVKKALPEGTSEKAMQKIVGDVYNSLDRKLRENRDLSQQLRRAYQTAKQGRDYSDRQKAAIVNLVYSRTKQALPGVAREVISEWTQGILRSNQERVTKQKTAASRVDLGSGATPGSSPGREPDFSKMSDEQVLEYYEKR